MNPPPANRPLNTMFVITSMPVGGAETLLVNMLRRFDNSRINPSICCLKDKDELGELASLEFPVYSNLIHHKFDVAVIRRLRRLFKKQNVDAVVTVGAGDKMFWGRLAARYSRIPVILSALHSTGWPDGVGRLNRLLTGITTGFIAVARSHGQYMVEREGFPVDKVFVIPNGIDTRRFQNDDSAASRWRKQLGIPAESPVVGIVAALRPEKNHRLFVETAGEVIRKIENAHFVIVGQGEEQPAIEKRIGELGISSRVHLAGCTHDIPGVLSMFDLFALTSDNEASPVSIMEAMSCRRPVVATDVGSVNELVTDGTTGLLVPAGDRTAMAAAWCQILDDHQRASRMGAAGRQHVVERNSLEAMTGGYMELIERLFFQRSVSGFRVTAGSGESSLAPTNSNS